MIKSNKIMLMCLVLILLSLNGYAEETPLDGVWQLVSAQHQYEDNGPIITLPVVETFKSYKILKDGYYSILTQDPTKNIFGAHMGYFSIKGNLYTEQFVIHKQSSEINKSAAFTFKILDDKWYIYSEKITEVWQRVTPSTTDVVN